MSGEEADLGPAPGTIAAEVSAEFPGLRLDWVTVRGQRRPSTRAVIQRLRDLSSRYRGGNVIAMRTQPIPHAYRAFFRQIGLDPDVERVPSEQVAVARLLHGQFRSHDLVQDALLIALIETGVPVWAVDAGRVSAGGLGIRTSTAADRLGSHESGRFIQSGRLVVADADTVHGLLFGPLAREDEVTHETKRMMLFSVGVDGVPAIHVEEALWVCLEALRAG
jgi:DNA/RNA-binding domain of Phe-tRNA-synthetase-like protein